MNSGEIVRNATERYDAKLQELKDKEDELNRSVSDFKNFWWQTLNDNISRFREYADDIGMVAKENEYEFKGIEFFSPIKVEQFIDERKNYSAETQLAIKQDFSEFFKDLSGDGSKGEAVAKLAVGLAVNFAAGLVMNWIEEQKAMPRAMEYEKEIDIAIENMKKTFSFYDAHIREVNKVWNITKKVAKSTQKFLDELEPLVPDFRFDDEYYIKILEDNKKVKNLLEKASQIPLIKEKNIAPELISISEKISTLTIKR
jgi:hypothetical protein